MPGCPLTGRLALARCVVDDGRPLRHAAGRFQTSPTTATCWADRTSHLNHSPRPTPSAANTA